MTGRHPSTWGTHQETLLDQVGLQYILDGSPLFAYRCRQALDPNRAAIELLHDGLK